MPALRFCKAFGFLGLLGRAAGDREAQTAVSKIGAELHEHSSLKTNSSLKTSNLPLRYCCLIMDEAKINSFNIDAEDATFGTITERGDGAGFSMCKITAVPFDCLEKEDDNLCNQECHTKIKGSKHYWHLVVERMKQNLDDAKKQQEEKVRDSQSVSDRAISAATMVQGQSKRDATDVRDHAIQELGKEIENVGKQIKHFKDGDSKLKKHTEDIQDLAAKLSEAQNATGTDSAESIWKKAHAAADTTYATAAQAAGTAHTNVKNAEKQTVDDADGKLSKATEKYGGLKPAQKVPEGCKKSGGWEGSQDIDASEDCCCSLCTKPDTHHCTGVKTKPSFIDWDRCFTSKPKHEQYSRSLFNGCDGFKTPCDQCITKACDANICPKSR